MGRRKREHRRPPSRTAEPARPADERAAERASRWRSRTALAGLVAAAAGVILWQTVSLAGDGAPVPDPRREGMFAPVALAIGRARDAVLADGRSATAWGGLGEVCDAHHLYDEAVGCYERAHALDPREFRWIYHLAVVRDYMGADCEEVVLLFDRAVRMEPDYPPAQVRYGEALARQGRLEEASQAYVRAIELDPAFAMAHRKLGQVLLAQEDRRGAIEHLERSAELDPSDGVVFASLARAYWLEGDEARAARATGQADRKKEVFGLPDPLRHAVDELSLAPPACRGRALEAMQNGQWARAIENLELLRLEFPAEGSLELRLGICLRRAGRNEAARPHLERALELDGTLGGAHAELASLDEAGGQLASAAEHLRRAVAQRPEDAALHKRLGGLLGMSGDLPGAVLCFERAAALTPPDAELLHNWGTALHRLRRTAEACERLRAALALEPGNAATHFNLALALEELGERDEAIAHYERVVALDSRLPAPQRLAALRAGGER